MRISARMAIVMQGPGRCAGFGYRRDRGVVLLLVLMVIAVLMVLVGQFAYSALLDRKVARNFLDSSQAGLDAAGAAQAVCEHLDRKAGAPLKEPEQLMLDMEGVEVSIVVEDEQGKFNVNSLRTPPPGVSAEEAEAALEALLKSAGKSAGSENLELGESVISLVKDGDAPILTLGGLSESAGGGAEAAIGGSGEVSGEESRGVAEFLTVSTDGRINPASAPDEVLAAVAGLDDLEGGQADLLRTKLANPAAEVPEAVAEAAARAAKWMTGESTAFSAVISTDRSGASRRIQVVLRKAGNGFHVAVVNELE